MKLRTIHLLLVLVICLCSYLVTDAQNTRISDHNNIGWYVYNGTIKLDKKWGIHTEYQWRRDHVIKDW